MNGYKKSKGIFLISVLLAVALVLPAAEKAFLWEIQGEHGRNYILGSIHLLKKEMYPLNPVIERAFNAADVLVLELDLSGDKMTEMSLQLMGRGVYTGEETLRDHISADAYERVETILKERYGTSIDFYKKFRPWFLALTIESIELLKMGYNPEYGVDIYLLRKAEGKKKIEGLETVASQLALFESMDDEEGEKFLLYTIEEIDREKKYLTEIVRHWERGDVAPIERILTEIFESQPELRSINRKLLDDRNRDMVHRIEDLMETGRVHFIVVGAAHLIGEAGILEMLRSKGYGLRQL
jgi:uncharacterized protein YbaP (TraB family)